MKVAVFSSRPYDIHFLNKNNKYNYTLKFFETRLKFDTVSLAKGFEAISVFVNDIIDEDVLIQLKKFGIKYVVLRCAGYNNIDLKAAQKYDVYIARVPKYSPEAVAEHTVGLILSLSRKFHKAYARIRDNNFNLDGLLGFNLHGKTVGIIGTGAIGVATIKALSGFGVKILCYDPTPNHQTVNTMASYTSLEEVYQKSDIISLHCPLTPETFHLINNDSIKKMKSSVMLINTSRGALINTKEIISALKSERVSYLGIDVYEQEGDLFFEDLSNEIIQDDDFQRLITLPNVLITGHQAFFTREALEMITTTTIENLRKMKSSDELNGPNFLTSPESNLC